MSDTVPRESPYAGQPIYLDMTTGERFYAPRLPRTLPPSTDDATVEWRDGMRLTGLAHEQYGSVLLWWVACDLNDVVDPFAIAPGTVLRLPTRARVELELLR